MKILVWDVPTRLFHWLFALSFLGAWVTAEWDNYRDIHVFLGYVFFGLLVFRLIWGIVGSRYARFGSFLFGPVEGFKYLLGIISRNTRRYLGHNPAGAWAIYLLLVLGVAVSLTGIALLGGEEQHGVFTGFTAFAGGEAMEEVHEALATTMLCIVIGHIIGVFAESWAHRENLARAMVTGIKDGNADDGIGSSHYLIGALLVIAVATFSIWFVMTI